MVLVRGDLRTALQSEIPQIVEIDKGNFIHTYEEDSYREMIKDRRCNVLVMVDYDRVIGFCVYMRRRNAITRQRELHIIRFAVAPGFYRRGIGRRLIYDVKRRADQSSSLVIVDICERELWNQQFMRACGFHCRKIINASDGINYQFVYPHWD